MIIAVLLALLHPGNDYCADRVCYVVNRYCDRDATQCWDELDTFRIDEEGNEIQ